jgi:hypothetical protein
MGDETKELEHRTKSLPESNASRENNDDLMAVLESQSMRWKVTVNLAPRWRLYLGAGLLAVLLSEQFRPLLAGVIRILMHSLPIG